MSILLDLVHHIYDEAYPLVKTIINDVKGIDHEVVERVKEKVVAAAERVEDAADVIGEHLEEEASRVTAAILDARAAQRELQEHTSYDWRQSIVDLMKLNDRDPSFSNRQRLAIIYHIPDYKGTEGQNIEMHRRFMKWLGIGI